MYPPVRRYISSFLVVTFAALVAAGVSDRVFGASPAAPEHPRCLAGPFQEGDQLIPDGPSLSGSLVTTHDVAYLRLAVKKGFVYAIQIDSKSFHTVPALVDGKTGNVLASFGGMDRDPSSTGLGGSDFPAGRSVVLHPFPYMSDRTGDDCIRIQQASSNAQEYRISVRSSEKSPVLSISAYEIQPKKPGVEDTVSVRWTVTNCGQVPAGRFNVAVRVDQRQVRQDCLEEGLGANQSRTFETRVGKLSAGWHQVIVTADLNNEVHQNFASRRRSWESFEVKP